MHLIERLSINQDALQIPVISARFDDLQKHAIYNKHPADTRSYQGGDMTTLWHHYIQIQDCNVTSCRLTQIIAFHTVHRVP